MNTTKWLQKHCEGLQGKRVVITGATGGLGKEICFHLAQLNANITLLCRNQSRANDLIYEIKKINPKIDVEFLELDLTSLASVKKCIIELKKYNGIDILINNAGIYNVPLEKLPSGFNNVFQVNFLYTYYLTKQLLPELSKKENSVCITLSSIAYNYSKLDRNDIDFSNKKRASKIYGNSKRFLTASLYELFKTTKVNLAIVHPGITLTNMTNHYPKAINWLVKFAIKLIFASPKKASLSIILGTKIYTKNYEWIGPKLFNIWGKPKKQKLNTISVNEAKQIFEIAEKLYLEIK